ncbi:OsmC family protein [Ruegeria lacuscaerulensis]|uniref:OsmC family protein n=1 Tax=Ruegeria lacuscaerulensis TaxID=55218 RepID=UPI00147BA091|nr:OsmC family protein [Ruegeria lacuscaerulensis]
MEANAIYQGQAGRSMVHVGPFALDDTPIDRPARKYAFPFGNQREVEDLLGMEGSTDRIEPVEMVLASIAACLVNSISVNAARLGIDTSGIKINVRTTLDPRGLLGLAPADDSDESIGEIEYDVKVDGDISDDDLEMVRKLCLYSPVYGMVSKSIKVRGEVTRV